MTHWHEATCAMGRWRAWLTDRGSLTGRLRARCPGLDVLRLRQLQTRPHPDEHTLLALPRQHTALLREVLLRCGQRPLVFAHTVIPLAGLKGPWQGLVNLGNRPLGAALFADPRIQRFPLQYRALDARHRLYQATVRACGPQPSRLWARRSLFSLDEQPILVTEVFLPAVLELPCP